MTKILLCSCENKYMDSKYGKGMRVCNYALKGGYAPLKAFRCTVCTRTHQVRVNQL